MLIFNKKQFKEIEQNKTYAVSGDGDVINRETKYILKPLRSLNGYSRVSIRIGNKKHNLSIHRLVANAFIPNPYKKPQVNHIDGVKTNNKTVNLEWSTAKDNTNHAYSSGLSTLNNSITTYDIKTNTTTTYQSLQQFSKILKIDLKHFIGYVKYSKKYPILNRYIVTILDLERYLNNLNSSLHGSKIYCYDRLTNKITKYLSIGTLTYDTGIRSIKRLSENFLLNLGYIISSKQLDIDECFNKFSISEKRIKDERHSYRKRQYNTGRGYYLVKDMVNTGELVRTFKNE